MTNTLSDYQRQYRDANREKVAERQRQYYEANREKVAERKRLKIAARLSGLRPVRDSHERHRLMVRMAEEQA